MASAMLTVPLPPCPSCQARLLGDERRRTCERCGRAFALAIGEPVSGEVYRAAPIVDIVPVRERPPALGVVVMKDDDELALRVGDARMMSRPRATALVAGSISIAWAVFEKFTRGWSVAAALCAGLVVFFVAMTLYLVSRDPSPAIEHEVLSVAEGGGSLVWQIVRQKVRVAERTVALAELVGAHDEGDCIRIDLEGREPWRVGQGLGVPARARRWVAERVAQLAKG